jgi:hypothetical protein
MNKLFFRFLFLVIMALLISCSNSDGSNDSENPSNPQNEGSIANPIVLVVDTPRICKIGKLSDNALLSYYKFDIGTTGTYYIKGTSFSPSSVTGFTPTVSTLSDFTGFPIYTSPYTDYLTCTTLNASTTYYLELGNMYNDTENIIFSLDISTTP